MVTRYATAGYGVQDAGPGVCTEERGGDVGVLEVEQGGGEGLEGEGGVCGKVDDLDLLLSSVSSDERVEMGIGD